MIELTEFSLRQFVAKRFDPGTKGCLLPGFVVWTPSWRRLLYREIADIDGKKENLHWSVRAGKWLRFMTWKRFVEQSSRGLHR